MIRILLKNRVIELRQILKKSDLPISRLKQILIDRILDSQDTECSSSYNNRMEIEENLNKNNLDEYGYGGIFYHKAEINNGIYIVIFMKNLVLEKIQISISIGNVLVIVHIHQ